MRASIVHGFLSAAAFAAFLGMAGTPAASADETTVGARGNGEAVTAGLAATATTVQLAQTQSAAAPPDPYAADEAKVQHLLDSTKGSEPPRAFVDGLYEDPNNARRPMAEYLSVGDPSPEARAQRAVTLARGIINNRRGIAHPEERDVLINTLLDVASEVVCSAYFVGSEVAEGYVPRASTFPFDFGAANSQVASGYTLVTPQSSMFQGGSPTAREGLGTGALLFDAISGVDKVATFVPNGRYILIVLTAVGGNYETFRMTVNGVDHWIVWTPLAEWPLGDPLLVSAGMPLASAPVGGFAGKLSLPVRVADGVVTVDFDSLPGSFPIAAMELVLYDEDVSTDPKEDDCLQWDRAQREAIARLLTEGGGTDKEPPLPPVTECKTGSCPTEEPVDPSPSGAI